MMYEIRKLRNYEMESARKRGFYFPRLRRGEGEGEVWLSVIASPEGARQSSRGNCFILTFHNSKVTKGFGGDKIIFFIVTPKPPAILKNSENKNPPMRRSFCSIFRSNVPLFFLKSKTKHSNNIQLSRLR